MKNLIKQLSEAGDLVRQAVGESIAKGEDEIFSLMAARIEKNGHKFEDLDKFYDLGFQDLEIDMMNGLLINQLYILGEKSTEKVLCACRLEVSYKPEGFISGGRLSLKVSGRVEEVTDSIFYPNDEEVIFKH